MRITLISVVALLGLMFPQMLLAGGKTSEFTMTPRAQKIFDQAPKTPEELLRVIKKFMDNPKLNGYEFGEIISGIDREHWGNPKPVKNGTILMYSPFGPHSPYYFRDQKKKQPAPYSTPNIKITNNYLLHDLHIKRLDHICVSPTLVREELGDPSQVYVESPDHPFSGSYRVSYFYENSAYRMRFFFPVNREQENDETLSNEVWQALEDYRSHNGLCVSLIKIHSK